MADPVKTFTCGDCGATRPYRNSVMFQIGRAAADRYGSLASLYMNRIPPDIDLTVALTDHDLDLLLRVAADGGEYGATIDSC